SARPPSRAATRSAARPAVCTASAWSTWAGSAARARVVSSSSAAITHTKSTGQERSRSARAPSAAVQATVTPPSSAAATLSGWPSSAAASGSGSASRPAQACPAATPAAIVAALEPSPRASGMRFRIANESPAGSAPAAAKARTNRLAPAVATPSAPSPSTRTSPASPPATDTTTSLRSSSATARQSNPGPRLADEAGAVTLSRSGKDRLRAGRERDLLEAVDLRRAAQDLGALGAGGVGILEAVAGEHADDGRAGLDEAVGAGLEQGRDGRRRGRLAEHA